MKALLMGAIMFLSLFSWQAPAKVVTKLKELCFKHLVQEDPYPYAEESATRLIYLYRLTYDQQVKSELDFRLEAYMLTQNEAIEFLHIRKFDKVSL